MLTWKWRRDFIMRTRSQGKDKKEKKVWFACKFVGWTRWKWWTEVTKRSRIKKFASVGMGWLLPCRYIWYYS